MKKLSLNIGERLVLSNVINQFGQGLSLSGMNTCMKIIDKIAINDKEAKKVKLENKNNRLIWENEKYSVDIDFSEDEMKLINEFVKKKDEDKKYSVSEGKVMLTLIDKIKGLKKDEKK